MNEALYPESPRWCRTTLMGAILATSLALPASATQVDLAMLSFADPFPIIGGGGTQSTSFSVGATNATLSTSGGDVLLDLIPYENKLKHADILDNVLGADGVCAGSNTPVLTVVDCSAPVTFEFDAAVSSAEIQFDNALTVLSGMTFDVLFGDASSASGLAGAILAVDALFVDIGVNNGLDGSFYFDGSGRGGVKRITYNPTVLTNVTGPVARYLIVDEAAVGAPVPLPPAIFGLAAALAGLGVVARRRGGSQ